MEKSIICAKCDAIVKPKKFCDCGNKIAGLCRKHKVLYEMNILPNCPACLMDELVALDNSDKLKKMLEERKSSKTVIVITSADGIRLKKKPREKSSSYPSYIPAAPQMEEAPKPPKFIPAGMAARMAAVGNW